MQGEKQDCPAVEQVLNNFIYNRAEKRNKLVISPHEVVTLYDGVGQAVFRTKMNKEAPGPVLLVWKYCQPMEIFWFCDKSNSIHFQYKSCIVHDQPKVLLINSSQLNQDLRHMWDFDFGANFPPSTVPDKKLNVAFYPIKGFHSREIKDSDKRISVSFAAFEHRNPNDFCDKIMSLDEFGNFQTFFSKKKSLVSTDSKKPGADEKENDSENTPKKDETGSKSLGKKRIFPRRIPTLDEELEGIPLPDSRACAVKPNIHYFHCEILKI